MHHHALPILALVALASCQDVAVTTPEGVLCAGLPARHKALLAAPHPFIFRGIASAITPSSPPPALGQMLLPSAHAYALDIERPLARATITITYERLAHPEAEPTPVSYTATTDEEGRFCIVAPELPAEDETIMLTATHGSLVVRQLGVHSFDADLNAVSEAVTRLVIERDRRTHALLAAQQWLNLRTLTDTRVGLLSDVNTRAYTTHEALVTDLVTLLRADPEIAAILGEVSLRPNEERARARDLPPAGGGLAPSLSWVEKRSRRAGQE